MGRHMVGASQRLAGRPIPSEFGSALKIKRRGGVLLGEHRGWILRMASLYEVRPETIMVPFQTTDGAHQLQTIRWFRLQTGSLLGFLSD